MSEFPIFSDEDLVYEPPVLVEAGDFVELTLGTVGQISDDGALRDN